MLAASVATTAGLLVALGGTSLLAFIKSRHKHAPINAALHLSSMWALALAVVAICLVWEGRPLASIGIAWGHYGAWAAGAMIGVTMVTLTVLSLHLGLQRGRSAIPEGSARGLKRLTDMPLWFRYAAVLTAAVTEEILFRGYPIERLQEITANVWLAAALPLIVFVVAHLGGWSAGHLVGVLFGGVLLTAIYLATRDLVACMITHALIDSTIIFLPALLRRYGNRSPASGPAGGAR